jgi:DNA replication initiation complex subunit (GINS family)
MSPPTESLQYKDVMEIWQKEKKNMSLSEVRHDFYPSLREMVSRMERDRETETAKDPYSALSRSLNQQLINIREKAGSIFDFRLEKIFRMAVRGAGGSKVDTARMTEEEKGIFEEVLGRAKGLRADALGTVRPAHPEFQRMSAVQPPAEPSTPAEEVQVSREAQKPARAEDQSHPKAQTAEAQQPVAKKMENEIAAAEGSPRPERVPERKSEPSAEAKSSGSDRSETMLLRILEDIPPIAGPSGTYKLGREDIVTLPTPMAKALVKRGKAIEIVPNRA